MRVAIGCDHAGIDLKNRIVEELTARGLQADDVGVHTKESCDYPDIAHALATKVAGEAADRGILICGTGVGMSIAANRHSGVRAVVCSEPLSARMARSHNDANVLCIGERVVGEGTALEIVDAFLTAEFEGGRHARRVGKIELVP